MEQVPLKLFGTRSSFYVHRVQIALHLKGVKYDFIEEDLENKSESLLLYNPIYKKVPVLLHGDCPIVESTIILEYIDEVLKGFPVIPVDAYERAVVRFWCHLFDDKLKTFGMMLRSSNEERAAAITNFRENLMLLEGEFRDGFFKGRQYFGGEKIGMLDIVAGCGSHWITVFEELSGVKILDSESFPLYISWLEKFMESPEVKGVLPPVAELIMQAKNLFYKSLLVINDVIQS